MTHETFPQFFVNIDTGRPFRAMEHLSGAESLCFDGTWERADQMRFLNMGQQIDAHEFKEAVRSWLLETVKSDEAAVKKALESVGLGL